MRPLLWTHISNLLLNFCIKIPYRNLELNLCLHNCFLCPISSFLSLLSVLSSSIQLFPPKPKISDKFLISSYVSNHPALFILIPWFCHYYPNPRHRSSLSEYWYGFLTFFQCHSFIPLIHFPHGNPECLFKNIKQIICVSQLLLLCYSNKQSKISVDYNNKGSFSLMWNATCKSVASLIFFSKLS